MRIQRILTALLLAVTALLTTGATCAEPAPATTAFTIKGLDLHDAQLARFGDTYYMYGSMYGCGFQWYGPAPTTWCGFGVSTAPSPQGPWSPPKQLFDPASQDPSFKRSWQDTCAGTSQGCFNPRMIQRTGWGSSDGVFILWFNAPRQYSDGAPNAYNAMGCAGPLGPCGPGAQPYGSYSKPNLDICSGANGDFGFIQSATPGARPAIICTRAGNSGLSIQELNWWGTGGNTGVGVTNVAGLTGVEGPGGWWDATTNQYVITYADQGCGYCSGTPLGYATAPTLYSGWTAPTNVGWGQPAYARRDFDVSSCGGQARTIAVLDGQPWQIIDLWLGTRNETQANTHVVPLHYTPTTGTPGDGQVWRPPLHLEC
ncbi:hypothetical protein ACF1AX_31195 [Streptomyces sp. NPDC014802]|uniref:hypothetical protein n=1 Tax=Streptomyces sp. NPDC014802 TaxID=3364917 RepID=UPI003700EB2F